MAHGATFREISEELDRGEIVIYAAEILLVCGLTEAGNKQSLGKTKVNLVALVSKAKGLCRSLKVSSILSSAKPNERINQLNDMIRDGCEQLGVIFVDNDKNFLHRGDTRDGAAFPGARTHCLPKESSVSWGTWTLPFLLCTIPKNMQTTQTKTNVSDSLTEYLTEECYPRNASTKEIMVKSS